MMTSYINSADLEWLKAYSSTLSNLPTILIDFKVMLGERPNIVYGRPSDSRLREVFEIASRGARSWAGNMDYARRQHAAFAGFSNRVQILISQLELFSSRSGGVKFFSILLDRPPFSLIGKHGFPLMTTPLAYLNYIRSALQTHQVFFTEGANVFQTLREDAATVLPRSMDLMRLSVSDFKRRAGHNAAKALEAEQAIRTLERQYLQSLSATQNLSAHFDRVAELLKNLQPDLLGIDANSSAEDALLSFQLMNARLAEAEGVAGSVIKLMSPMT